MAASASAQASRPPSAGKSGLGKPRTTVSDLLAAVRRKKTRQQARQLRRVESEVATTAEAESHPGTEAPATDSATALPGKGQVLRRHTSIRNATHAVAAALSMAAGAAHPTEGQPTAEHERHPRTLSGAAVAAIISLFALIYAFARYSVTVSAEELLGLPMTIAHQVVHAYQSWPEILAFSIGVMLVQLIDHAIRRLLLRLVFASELSQSPLDDVLVRMAIVFFPAPASAQQAHDELKGAASHFGVDLSDDESLSSDDSDSSEESEGVFGSLQHRLSRRLGGKVATRGRQGSKTPPSAKAPPLRSIFFAKAVDVATWPSTVEEHVAVTTANLVLGVCLGVFLSLSICMEDECDDAAPQPTAGSPATPQPVTVTKGLLSSIAGVALTMRLAVPVDHASTLLVSDFLAIGTAVGAGGHRTFANFVSAFRIVLWMLVLLVVIKILGGDVSAMIQGLGFLGFGLAFAMQKTIQDAVVALVLFMDKPFVVGDLIDIGNVSRARRARVLLCVRRSHGRIALRRVRWGL